MNWKHYKTTAAGVVCIVGTICVALFSLYQGEHVDWSSVAVRLSIGWGLIKAADAPNPKP